MARGTAPAATPRGHGEQSDLCAAIAFLKSKGIETVHLAGYSFGTWVNAMAVTAGLSVEGMTMVAPPVAFMTFEDEIRLPGLSLVVAGGRDEFGPVDLIRPALNRWNPLARLEIVPDADHFFFGFLNEVTASIVGAP